MQQGSEKHLEETAAKQFSKKNLEGTARDWCMGIGTELLEEKAK